MENSSKFDVFLCHNSKDKPEVREIRDRLKQVGLNPWLDEEELLAGGRWLELLQEEIVQVHSAAIFFGSHGIGRVQKQEIEILSNVAMERDFPLIPVFLINSVMDRSELSPILKLRGWVDFREPDPIKKLFSGIKEKSVSVYLQELGTKRKLLEQRLREVEIEIGKITHSLSRDIDPSLNAVLEWLKGREDLAKTYGNLVLRNNLDLKKELKKRNEVELFYVEIDSCLELIFYALLEDDESLLHEPGTPMLMDDENYQFSISEIHGVYKSVFDTLKRAIPNFETSARCKLESYIDQLVNRFLVDI
jgi:hypothetical protein